MFDSIDLSLSPHYWNCNSAMLMNIGQKEKEKETGTSIEINIKLRA